MMNILAAILAVPVLICLWIGAAVVWTLCRLAWVMGEKR